MVDLDLSWGVISSTSLEKDAKEAPLNHEEEKSIPEDGSTSEIEVEKPKIKESKSNLEPLPAAELDSDSFKPSFIPILPSPRLATISEESLSSHEEDEELNSLDEETEVEALLYDYPEEEEKELKEEFADDET